jgi:hypothetical protein
MSVASMAMVPGAMAAATIGTERIASLRSSSAAPERSGAVFFDGGFLLNLVTMGSWPVQTHLAKVGPLQSGKGLQ